MVRNAVAGPSGRSPLEIVVGQDERVGRWIVQHIPDINQTPGGFSAIGIARNGELVGGVLYTNFRRYRDGGDIELWCAGHDWVSRKIVGVCIGYPFYQLGCHRLTALVRRSNKASRRLLEGVGFRFEGTHREAFGPKSEPALSYGMMRSWNRWPWPHDRN